MKLSVGLLSVIGVGLVPGAAQAAITINIAQAGASVVATGAGTFNTTGLPAGTTNNYTVIANGARSAIFVGNQANTTRYLFSPSSSAFGTINTFTSASSSTGDTFGIYGTDSALHLPENYVSGTALSGSSTFNGQTLASLGLTNGTYVFNFANDRVTVIVGTAASAVPEPASWALMVMGFGAAGLALRARQRRRVAVTYA